MWDFWFWCNARFYIFLHLEQGATEVLRETLHYIKTNNFTATFTKRKMFLINYILTFGSKASFESHPFKQKTPAGLTCTVPEWPAIHCRYLHWYDDTGCERLARGHCQADITVSPELQVSSRRLIQIQNMRMVVPSLSGSCQVGDECKSGFCPRTN